MVRIYTKTGDDGTTGLLYGGRVRKDSTTMQVNGAVDEAQAMMGLARAEAVPDSELDAMLVRLERDLYVLMAEVATDVSNRGKLTPGTTLVTEEMVAALEVHIDELIDRFEMPAEFVVPGANRVSAALDVSRTVVRRAERWWCPIRWTDHWSVATSTGCRISSGPWPDGPRVRTIFWPEGPTPGVAAAPVLGRHRAGTANPGKTNSRHRTDSEKKDEHAANRNGPGRGAGDRPDRRRHSRVQGCRWTARGHRPPASVGGVQIPTDLDAAWLKRQGFTGKVGQSIVLGNEPGNPATVLLGLGDHDDAAGDDKVEAIRRSAAAFVRSAGEGGDGALVIAPGLALDTAVVAAALAEGATLAAYRFSTTGRGTTMADWTV